MPASVVALDLNSPKFLETFLTLEKAELAQVAKSLRRAQGMDWAIFVQYDGFNWEEIKHLGKAPNGAAIHSVRLSKKIRALGYRDKDILRLISLHPDHDSAYTG